MITGGPTGLSEVRRTQPVRMFRALTPDYPSLDRLLALRVPTLVLGDPGPADAQPRAECRRSPVAPPTLSCSAVIEGAAHAINFSHPGELANVIRLFMADQPDRGRPELTRPGHRVRDPIAAHMCQPGKPTDKLPSVRLEDHFGCWPAPR